MIPTHSPLVTPGPAFRARLDGAETFLRRSIRDGRHLLELAGSPAREARAAGFDIPKGSARAFNAMFSKVATPRLVTARHEIEQGGDPHTCLEYPASMMVCWPMGVEIAAQGQGFTQLEESSGVTRHLAALVDCPETTALDFLHKVGDQAGGADEMAGAICLWSGTVNAGELG